jgi:hypothetical protein
MALGDGVLRRMQVFDGGIARQIVQPRGKPSYQPFRWLRVTNVDGEIQHPRRDSLITVVTPGTKRARIQTRHQ